MSVTQLMNELIIKNPELAIDGGIGYCGYGSYLLQQELTKRGIANTALHGVDLTHTAKGIKAYEGNKEVILALDASGPTFNKRFKERYVARGYRLPKGCGHIVILIDQVIYDITSKQFKLPHVYTIHDFLDIWTKVFTCELKVDMNIPDDFYMRKVTHKEKLKVTTEMFRDKVQFNTPTYATW